MNAVAKIQCPVCGHEAEFVLYKEAVLNDLEDLARDKKMVKEFKDWLDIEIYCDRLDLSIRERDLIVKKLRELTGDAE